MEMKVARKEIVKEIHCFLKEFERCNFKIVYASLKKIS